MEYDLNYGKLAYLKTENISKEISEIRNENKISKLNFFKYFIDDATILQAKSYYINITTKSKINIDIQFCFYLKTIANATITVKFYIDDNIYCGDEKIKVNSQNQYVISHLIKDVEEKTLKLRLDISSTNSVDLADMKVIICGDNILRVEEDCYIKTAENNNDKKIMIQNENGLNLYTAQNDNTLLLNDKKFTKMKNFEFEAYGINNTEYSLFQLSKTGDVFLSLFNDTAFTLKELKVISEAEYISSLVVNSRVLYFVVQKKVCYVFEYKSNYFNFLKELQFKNVKSFDAVCVDGKIIAIVQEENCKPKIFKETSNFDFVKENIKLEGNNFKMNGYQNHLKICYSKNSGIYQFSADFNYGAFSNIVNVKKFYVDEIIPMNNGYVLKEENKYEIL